MPAVTIIVGLWRIRVVRPPCQVVRMLCRPGLHIHLPGGRYIRIMPLVPAVPKKYVRPAVAPWAPPDQGAESMSPGSPFIHKPLRRCAPLWAVVAWLLAIACFCPPAEAQKRPEALPPVTRGAAVSADA